MKKFVCSVCGYVHVGDAAPQNALCAMLVPKSSLNRRKAKWNGHVNT